MTISSTYTTESSYNLANTIDFAINRKLLDVNTVLPCQILAINDDGTFNIQSIVNGLDASNNPIEPNIIYNVPATIKMGGNAGVIIQYAVGDIVLTGFCQRDITTCKQNWQQSNPASLRKFWINDAIIIDCLSSTPPNIYIKVTSDGIEINSNDKDVNINANTVNVNSGQVNLGNGNLQPVILQNVAFDINLPDVAGGDGAVSRGATITTGGSSTIKASS